MVHPIVLHRLGVKLMKV